MKILFCKVSSMKYYKGACEKDIPLYGGKFVEENGYGHEEYNFLPIRMDGNEYQECMGFVEPKSNRGRRNSFHIEKIDGCEAMAKEPCVENVLVVWCAKRDLGDVTVVGWYKNATVYRDLQDWFITFENGEQENRGYNIRANADHCTLLPESERNYYVWEIPTAKYTKSYGFGQAMVWYPNEPEAKSFIERLVNNIDKYKGENWLNKYPEE
jgi:hypothetical protein